MGSAPGLLPPGGPWPRPGAPRGSPGGELGSGMGLSQKLRVNKKWAKSVGEIVIRNAAFPQGRIMSNPFESPHSGLMSLNTLRSHWFELINFSLQNTTGPIASISVVEPDFQPFTCDHCGKVEYRFWVSTRMVKKDWVFPASDCFRREASHLTTHFPLLS